MVKTVLNNFTNSHLFIFLKKEFKLYTVLKTKKERSTRNQIHKAEQILFLALREN